MKRILQIAAVLCLAVSCRSGRERIDVVPEYGPGIAEVKTAQGIVAGYKEGDLYIFKGLRYAVADRFMPPREPDSWEGVQPHRVYGPMCPQGGGMRGGFGLPDESNNWAYHTHSQPQHEDCLRVNIWTPGIGDGKRRPVMVWLHGGAFSASSGDLDAAYDGSRLAEKGDVVVLSLNHRLGVMGFLDLSSFGEAYKYSGNLGILDLVAALQWVKNNIAAFGGDPDNVTVFGQSGGGGKVSSLLGTPFSKGLVHKAIVQSGTSIRMAEAAYTRMVGEETVRLLGLDPSDVDKIRTLPLQDVLTAGNMALRNCRLRAQELGLETYYWGWSPTIDGDFFPEQLDVAFSRGLSGDVPLLVGSNLNEMRPVRREHGNMTWEDAEAEIRPRLGEKTDEYIRTYRSSYPASRPRDLVETDWYFRSLAVMEAIAKSRGGSKVYRYEMDWLSPAQDSVFRCPHNMEVPFAFNNVHISYGLTGYTEDARMMNRRISDAWISFARDGVPSSKALPAWEPFTEEGWATMILDNTCELRHHHDDRLLELTEVWQQMP